MIDRHSGRRRFGVLGNSEGNSQGGYDVLELFRDLPGLRFRRAQVLGRSA